MGGKWLPGCFVSARPWPGADSASGYIKRVTCLQVECTNNQRFFKNSTHYRQHKSGRLVGARALESSVQVAWHAKAGSTYGGQLVDE